MAALNITGLQRVFKIIRLIFLLPTAIPCRKRFCVSRASRWTAGLMVFQYTAGSFRMLSGHWFPAVS